MNRIKSKDIPILKKQLAEEQHHICPLCKGNLKGIPTKDLCLDHDHKTGHVRAVLCRNCNGCEGKVRNLANRAKRDGTIVEWLERVLAYWKTPWAENRPLHSKHRTEEEKRIRRNKKSRKRRQQKKAQQLSETQ